jgi:4'-phosphopantetheinyl transferase
MCITDKDLPSTIFLKDVPSLWKQKDILIFLIGLDSCTFGSEYLDDNEKKELKKLKTSYFRERYVVSRTVLKFVIHYLLEGQAVFKISTYKDGYGRVHVRDHEELHICISYTGKIVSLAISKVDVGIDMELIKPFSTGKFSKYLNRQALKTDGLDNCPDLLTLFTLKEAYSKFSNKSIISCINKELDLSSIYSSSYILNDSYILSIITDTKPLAINISYLQKIEASDLEI